MLPKVAHDADANALQGRFELCHVISHDELTARRIVRVMAGNDLQQQRTILDGPGHRAAMIETGRTRNDTAPAYESIRRLEARDAAQPSRES